MQFKIFSHKCLLIINWQLEKLESHTSYNIKKHYEKFCLIFRHNVFNNNLILFSKILEFINGTRIYFLDCQLILYGFTYVYKHQINILYALCKKIESPNLLACTSHKLSLLFEAAFA